MFYSKTFYLNCVILSFTCFHGAVVAQDKIFLKCEGLTTVVASEEKNPTNIEEKSFVKVNPLSLTIAIDKSRITIDSSYDFKKIDTSFEDERNGYLFEHGNLEIKDSYYDGYYERETYARFRYSNDKPFERALYSYHNMRLFLDRFNGNFEWRNTYFGNSSWINDLLPRKAKDKFLHLNVKGKCSKNISKPLF